MATLRLELDGGGLGTRSVVACNVMKEAGRVTSVAVRSDAQASFTVTPGDYVIQATLPSGETVTRAATVEKDGDVVVTIGLPVRDVKKVPRRASGHRRRASRRPIRDPDERVALSRDSGFGIGSGDLDALASEYREVPKRRRGERQGGPRSRRVWVGLWDDGEYVDWEPEVLRRAPGSVEFAVRKGAGSAIRVAAHGRASRIASLPPSGGAVISLSTDGVRSFDDGIRVEVSSPSAAPAAISAYLATGQVDAAATLAPGVVADAREMFREKVKDQDGAAVAGYFLLRLGKQEELGDWPANFAEWFSELPDAAIIHAWQLLRRPGVPDRDLALRQLERAALTGVPRYTEGLRLLFDGLQIFAAQEHDDGGAENALKHVKVLAEACDWAAVHTTYWGEEPGRPALRRHTKLPPERASWTPITVPVLGAP